MEAEIFTHPKITSTMIDDRIWYALCVESKKEFIAQIILGRHGLLTYIPVRKEWRYRNKYDRARRQNKQLVSYPETVGYVFTGFTPNQLAPENTPHWLKIFSISCVVGAVGTDGEPKQVDKEPLKDLARKYPNGVQRPDHEAYMRTHREYDIGDDVLICEGPFRGQVVPVVEIKMSHAVVNLSMFGITHRLTMNTFDLEKHVA